MSYSIQCEHCHAVLKSATPVPAGKKVNCPKCQQPFTTPDAVPVNSQSHAIQCTHCKAVLKSQAPVPAGKKVKCPKCEQLFRTPDAAPPAGPAAVAAPPAAPAPRANLNISIFTGDADAAIAGLMGEASGPAPDLDDDLVTEEEVVEEEAKEECSGKDGAIPFSPK